MYKTKNRKSASSAKLLGYANVVIEQGSKKLQVSKAIFKSKRGNEGHHKAMMKAASSFSKKNEGEYLQIPCKVNVIDTDNTKSAFALLINYKTASGNKVSFAIGIPAKKSERSSQEQKAFKAFKDAKRNKPIKAYMFLVSIKAASKTSW